MNIGHQKPDTVMLSLENLRTSLIRQEESIIFSLIERAQFKQNTVIYQAGGVALTAFDGSFCDYLIEETEKIHARVRRYTSPDEHPFSRSLPAPILPPLDYPRQIVPTNININDRILVAYIQEIIPKVCAGGDDQNYGSSATCDVVCLQALSKRIHYGKFVAEAKLQQAPERYAALIEAGDHLGVVEALTDLDVERRLLRRVEKKAAAYGVDIDDGHLSATYKIAPNIIRDIYRDSIIPLTKDVEVAYLLARNSPEPAQ